MQWYIFLAAQIQQCRKDRRVGICQGWPTDQCVGICAENRRDGMLVVPAVAVRFER